MATRTVDTAERERTPWVTHATLGGLAFMAGYDRSKTIKGGMVGLGIAGVSMAARYLSTPKDDSPWQGLVNTAWQTAEFSAITNLASTAMMRGGFLYKPVGRKLQRLFSTKVYPKIVKGVPSDIGGDWLREKKTLHGAVRGFPEIRRDLSRSVADILQEAAEVRKESPGFTGSVLSSVAGILAKGGEGAERVVGRYVGIGEKYLRGAAVGPRGPFEFTSGLFDISETVLKATENPSSEVKRIVKDFQGKRWGWSSGITTAALGKMGATESLYESIANLRKSGSYKVAKWSIKSRKYIEAMFGSPEVGRLVQQYGSINKIPTRKYLAANASDIFYGAFPAIVLSSPLLGYEALKSGYNKITGHHPGRMNSIVEDDIRSDFTAGKSYDPKDGSPSDPRGSYIHRSLVNRDDVHEDTGTGFVVGLADDIAIAAVLGVSSLAIGAAASILGRAYAGGSASKLLASRYLGKGSGAMGRLFSGSFRKGAASALIAGSLMLAGPRVAEAHNVIPVGSEAPIAQRASALRAQTDYIASIYDFGKAQQKNVSSLLYETAVHESELIKYRRQYNIVKGKRVETGVARSIWGVEPATAKDIVGWAKTNKKAMNLLTTTSGLTAQKLTAMTKADLADYLVKHDHFAVAIARLKYARAPGSIPSTLEERAAYYSKRYQTQNKPEITAKYISDNREMAKELEAASLSKVIKKHVAPKPYTHRVVGDLNQAKTMHGVASKAKKMNVMKKILSRTRM